MSGRDFTTRIGDCNRDWLSLVLRIPAQQYGIDLVNDKIGIEIKSRLDLYMRTSYAVHEYQVKDFPKQNKDKELYWAFVLYSLNDSVEKIKNRKNLKKYVTERKVWFFEWNWINDVKISRARTGPYRYVSPKRFENGVNFKSYERGNGLLYVPADSSLEGYL